MINIPYSVLLILIAAVITFALRAVPFLLFRGTHHMPPLVKKIADLLPPAIMAVLVIYCLKGSLVNLGVDTLASTIAVLVVIGIHLWKRNTLLSIFTGTGIYMLCIRMLPVLL
ncbi:MAG TPA: AzlD domain-containing protein [Lachnospiraceae bacterium]|nr:AzlD domain-containing protein [Lachnospiraceae bacterium]